MCWGSLPTTLFAGLSILVAVLTTAVFPFGLRQIAQLAPWVMATLLVRNVIDVGMVVWLAWRLAGRDPAAASERWV